MKTRLFVLTVLILAFAATVLAADDPFIGSWKMNVSKSTGNRVPKSASVTIQAQENGHKIIGISVSSEGQTSHQEWAGKIDGKNYPYLVNGQVTAQIAQTRIDTYTIHEVISTERGPQQGHVVVSKDGKTMIRTLNMKTQNGEDRTAVSVYEKQ